MANYYIPLSTSQMVFLYRTHRIIFECKKNNKFSTMYLKGMSLFSYKNAQPDVQL